MLGCLLFRNGIGMIGIKPVTRYLKPRQLLLGSIMNVLATGIVPDAAPLFTLWTLGWNLGDLIFAALMNVDED